MINLYHPVTKNRYRFNLIAETFKELQKFILLDSITKNQ